MQVVGKRSQKTFNLGDEVRVLVAATNLDKRLIDFDLVQE
jgi:exoribonuclease R